MERTPPKRIQLVYWLTLMVAQKFVFVMGDVAFTTEVGFLLTAIRNCRAFLAFVADRITGVILFLAI